MPLYEYKCQACGDVFEIIQKFSDQPLTIHEKCGGKVERLISVSALQFKGTGWYVTDYGKGNANGPKHKPDTPNGDHKSEKSNGDHKSEKSNGSSKSSDSPSKSDSPAGKTDSSSTTASTPSASKSDSK